MFERARALYHSVLNWWRGRELRRKVKAMGVTDIQEGPSPVYSEEYSSSSYVAPYSARGGRICTLLEKLGECRALFGYRPPAQDTVKLPAWEVLIEEWLETHEDAATAGDQG